ncbi:sortase domain-bontaining protein [Streptomyces luteogriseus]|uniref:sortase domain-containing protein n=1 Tax=Streptomyces luteogriseus TaxID=68233 RepID=UPI0037B87867
MDLGLDRDRRLTAPPYDDPKLVGWYRHGASPGEQGTAVAVGHLDTESGPAVFAGLPELKRGRIVKARRADGRIARPRSTRSSRTRRRTSPARRCTAPGAVPSCA